MSDAGVLDLRTVQQTYKVFARSDQVRLNKYIAKSQIQQLNPKYEINVVFLSNVGLHNDRTVFLSADNGIIVNSTILKFLMSASSGQTHPISPVKPFSCLLTKKR